MVEPNRQPPHFVPTLTEVVDRAARPSTTVGGTVAPASSGPSTEQWQQVADAVADRVMRSLKDRLRDAVADELERWVQTQMPALTDRVAQSLLDEVAEVCRQAVDEALGDPASSRSGSHRSSSGSTVQISGQG